MCGIAGIASSEPLRDREVVIRMRDSVTHRGPDDAGAWWSNDGHVALAQRRLSIIDLSPGGHQPMLDPQEEICIIFNGELYNFRDLRRELEEYGVTFRSVSDTEVVLQAYRRWGTDCLQRMNGMFAMAVYDSRARTLFIARDRAGEKPMFYRYADGTLHFASELKALLAVEGMPRKIDPHSLDHYLAYGYVPGAMCMLEGYAKLPAAHALLFDVSRRTLRTWRYWSIPEMEGPGLPAAEAEERFEELLQDSVSRQLISDVPIGILLSGGIDSSLVTAMAARSRTSLRTFNISFAGHGAYDEAPYARAVAKHFGTDHLDLVAEPATVELLPMLARQYDEPMADSSMVPTYLVSRLIRQHATVALGGDGGDELFGGYGHYLWVERQEKVRRRVPAPLLNLIGRVAAAAPTGVRGRNYALALARGAGASIAAVNNFFDPVSRARLYPHANGIAPTPEGYKMALYDPRRSTIQNVTRNDFLTYLADDILVKVDRASMLTSLEVRAPFLDYRIIEFAYSQVGDAMKIQGDDTKIMLRRIAKRLLPPGIDDRPKQGFSIPLHSWFKGRWGDYMEEVLRSIDPALFSRSEIASLIANQRRGLSNTHRLFALTIFELWRREYQIAWT